MKKCVKSIMFFLINSSIFYILPTLIVDTSSAMILLAILPLSCLFIAIIYGALYSFHISYPLLVALAFTPTMRIFFNESAWVYIPAFGIIALIGNFIGAGIYTYRIRKKQSYRSQ